MRSFYEKYKSGDYSQNGEAGIINECLKRMNITKGLAIEFGAPTQQYCSNIFHLPEFYWTRFYFDVNPSDNKVMKLKITTDNINSVVPDCQVLSIDVDGTDYELFKAWKNKCDILVIEINSSFAPDVDHYSHERGSSYLTMCKLLIEKGYMVVCHTGNIIAVLEKHRGLFPDITGDPIVNNIDYFKRDWL